MKQMHTDKYHYKFYITLVISLFITALTMTGLTLLDFLYKWLQLWIISSDQLYITFLILNLINNYYQVYAHIFTATKFLGYNKFVPPGSKDDQSLMVFTMSNIFDILGWLTIFIYYGFGFWLLVLLASVHYGSGITAIFFNDVFQKYYIGEPGKYQTENDSFGYKYWTYFRVIFVLTDAISRSYCCYYMSFSLYSLISG